MDERLIRMLKFLMSLNDPQISALLGDRGFDEETRAGGWDLLEKSAGRHLAVYFGPIRTASAYKGTISQLDKLENTWFDVADVALRRSFPVVHEKLFLNLSKVSGIKVVITVRTFFNRIDKMEAGGDETDRAALALLEKRGLTGAIRDQARSLLAQAETGHTLRIPEPDPEAEKERLAAMEEMWAWYKDWAKTARTVVSDKRLRISMGISKPRRSAPAEMAEDMEDDE